LQIILSRKGFDSKNGGQPSPILPDGTLLSLPILSKDDKTKFSELRHKGKSYLNIIQDLKPKTKIQNKYNCHLDPDIRKDSLRRCGYWTPLFGQTKAAQGKLKNNKVKEGDIFLFFGWFKQTEEINGKIKYVKGAPDLHIIFGYLQIGNIYKTNSNLPKDINYHAHAQKKYDGDENNCIYKASEKLIFSDSLSGGGYFNYHKDLILTKSGHSRSRWNLPDFFKELKITYHNSKSFSNKYFQSAAIGQEFIIQENTKVTDWAKNIILKGLRNQIELILT